MKVPPGPSVSILCVSIEAIMAADVSQGRVKGLGGNCSDSGAAELDLSL